MGAILFSMIAIFDDRNHDSNKRIGLYFPIAPTGEAVTGERNGTPNIQTARNSLLIF